MRGYITGHSKNSYSIILEPGMELATGKDADETGVAGRGETAPIVHKSHNINRIIMDESCVNCPLRAQWLSQPFCEWALCHCG